MDKMKVKAVSFIALALLTGFIGGYASKDLFDTQNSARANEAATKAATGSNVPVHKMKSASISTNHLIAPNLWSVFLDPFFTPVNLDIAPLALPNFVSFPMDVPAVKTVDGAQEIQIVAQLPGLSEKDVNVEVGTDVVTIKGEKKEEMSNNKSFSTVSQSFVRTVQLPCKVDGDKVKATLKNGVLTVSLPKQKN
ncbi:Hsp20/alpha crystallin family protein [bacterium]|nr:Hsp20/alpha crystallin family protein [bacterium]MBP9808149.1 Hsp20/alpha crystallin family protein [bacterium]